MFEGYCDNVQKLLLGVLRKHWRKGKGQSEWEKNGIIGRDGASNIGWLCASWLLVSMLVWLDPVLSCCTFLLNTISNYFLRDYAVYSQCVPTCICFTSKLQVDKPTSWKKPATIEIQGLSQRLVTSPEHRYSKDSQVLAKHPETWVSMSDKWAKVRICAANGL